MTVVFCVCFKKSRCERNGVHSDLAEMEGFEPPDGLTRQLISSQPRYDHFDTSPYDISNAC